MTYLLIALISQGFCLNFDQEIAKKELSAQKAVNFIYQNKYEMLDDSVSIKANAKNKDTVQMVVTLIPANKKYSK